MQIMQLHCSLQEGCGGRTCTLGATRHPRKLLEAVTAVSKRTVAEERENRSNEAEEEEAVVVEKRNLGAIREKPCSKSSRIMSAKGIAFELLCEALEKDPEM